MALKFLDRWLFLTRIIVKGLERLSMDRNMNRDLEFCILPVDTLIKNHLKGESQCNYEKYLLELINLSPYMLDLGDQEGFVEINEQSHGECDCQSGNYELDFKLLCGSSYLEMLQGTSPVEHKMVAGVIGFSSPARPGKKFIYTHLWNVLMNTDKKRLQRIKEGKFSPKTDREYIAEKDAYRFLQTIETKKNLFMLLPVEFYFNYDIKEEDAINELKNALLMSFGLSFNLSESRNKYDTFVVFIYNRYFRIMQYENNSFRLIDNISIYDVKIFSDLAIIGMNEFHNRNYLEKFNSPKEFEEEWEARVKSKSALL